MITRHRAWLNVFQAGLRAQPTSALEIVVRQTRYPALMRLAARLIVRRRSRS